MGRKHSGDRQEEDAAIKVARLLHQTLHGEAVFFGYLGKVCQEAVTSASLTEPISDSEKAGMREILMEEAIAALDIFRAKASLYIR